MTIEEVLSRHKPLKENLLKVLHEIQHNDPHQHIDSESMKRVANWLKVPLSSVYGVLKYYTMYSTAPRGKHIIRVCNSVVCHMEGSSQLTSELLDKVEQYFPEKEGELTFTVEHAECLGHCASAPVMMIDDQVYGSVIAGEIPQLLVNHQERGEHGRNS